MNDATESLGLKGIYALHLYVRDLRRYRSLLCDQLDFAELGVSGPELTEQGRQRSALFEAGDCRVLVCEPQGKGGRAWRFLNKHPEGIGTIAFEVEDIEHCFAVLEARGATIIDEIQRWSDDSGSLASFSITTPFGDATFRFVERRGDAPLIVGLETYETPRGGTNRLGFRGIDHITSNFPTMKPALLWMEHVLGFRPYWSVEFHTNDVAQSQDHGSGLKSVVMWDPHSGIKFANNEPARPHFRSSQINVFAEEHRGSGVQHFALSCHDILYTVRAMRKRQVEFMPTPGTYYDVLPQRLQALGVERIEENIDELRELEILVDGEAKGSYLLQIFMREAAGLFSDDEAGPAFIEIIQRKGDDGFGAGNFRALFESIERQQLEEGRV